jgi:hypothetical protein
MKLAIKQIEYIPCRRIFSWSHVGRNDTIAVNNFVDGPFEELKFTELTASLEEEWIESPSGIYSSVRVTGIIRANKEHIRSILSYLVMSKNVFRVTAMDGVKYVVGSLDYSPKTLFKLVISEITTSEYQFTILCKSTHGLLFDTVS